MVITRPLQKDPNQIKRIMMVLGGGYSAEAKAAFALYDSLGDGLTVEEKIAMAAYIDAEVANGNHAKKDYELIMSLSGANALVDYIGGKVATAVNAPTQSINGYIFDGATNYINTNYDPSTEATNYLLDDAQVGGYIHEALGSGSQTILGAQTSISQRTMLFETGGGRTNVAINSTADTPSPDIGDFADVSLIYGIRPDSANIDLILDGVDSSDITQASNLIPDVNFYIGARNNTGTADSFFTGTLSTILIGGVLVSQSGHNTNLKALITALTS